MSSYYPQQLASLNCDDSTFYTSVDYCVRGELSELRCTYDSNISEAHLWDKTPFQSKERPSFQSSHQHLLMAPVKPVQPRLNLRASQLSQIMLSQQFNNESSEHNQTQPKHCGDICEENSESVELC